MPNTVKQPSSLNTDRIVVRLVVRLKTRSEASQVGREVAFKVVEPDLIVESRVKVVPTRFGWQTEIGAVPTRDVAIDSPVRGGQVLDFERDGQSARGVEGEVGDEPVRAFRLRLLAPGGRSDDDPFLTFVVDLPCCFDVVVRGLIGEVHFEGGVGQAGDVFDEGRVGERHGGVGVVEVQVLEQLLDIGVCETSASISADGIPR